MVTLLSICGRALLFSSQIPAPQKHYLFKCPAANTHSTPVWLQVTGTVTLLLYCGQAPLFSSQVMNSPASQHPYSLKLPGNMVHLTLLYLQVTGMVTLLSNCGQAPLFPSQIAAPQQQPYILNLPVSTAQKPLPDHWAPQNSNTELFEADLAAPDVAQMVQTLQLEKGLQVVKVQQ